MVSRTKIRLLLHIDSARGPDSLNFPFRFTVPLMAFSVVNLPLSYLLAAVGFLASVSAFWVCVVRIYLLRRYYERQGVLFVRDCHAIIGAELRVSELRQKNKSHDWLYTERCTDLVGTIRGFSIQLYGTSAELCEKLIQRTGTHVDRKTPALFSFGRLSPHAITFTPYSQYLFKERKASLTRSLNDMKRLYVVANRQAEEALNLFGVADGTGRVINVRELLNHWTRETSGEFIWGKENVNRYVNVFDSNDKMTYLPFMTALNQTFTDLRFYSGKFWNRVYSPLAALPVTREARRLTYNIGVLRKEMDSMLAHPEKGSIAESVQRTNAKLGIPLDMTRDDLVTATVAGLDTVKSTTMGSLWHILQRDNLSWREAILDDIRSFMADPSTMYTSLAGSEKLHALICETLRFEPPGSLINNCAVDDFDLSLDGRSYTIKAGTRIVPCIHALHQNEMSWKSELDRQWEGLDKFDPARFLPDSSVIVGSGCFMPFGKGPRRCPGQGVGMMMVKTFVAAFLKQNSKCNISIPKGQTPDITYFNILSKATFDIHCAEET